MVPKHLLGIKRALFSLLKLDLLFKIFLFKLKFDKFKQNCINET